MKKGEIEDILLKFCFKDDNKKDADEAFAKFYREYSRYLYVVVANIKKNYPYYYDDLIDVVVSNTFLKIYNKPPMNFEILKEESHEEVNKKLKGYLSIAAKTVLYDLLKVNFFKQEHKLKIDDNDFDFDPPEIEQIEDFTISHNQKILREVLLTFKERDRNILLTLYQHYEKGKKSPKEVMQWLAEVHKTTDVNIRQIKSRCDKKICEYFEEHTKLKPVKS